MSLNHTPSANRLHIGIFGQTNSGKSSFINALTGQEVSIVSDIAGTTTDPVYKPMEINPLGACVIIDTAGIGDSCVHHCTCRSICSKRSGDTNYIGHQSRT